ncbi:MAG: HD domain-containing protein [Anaerolineae bacterium]|nr:HD domain-containing protein [Gemmatimonadaceae bacterium]
MRLTVLAGVGAALLVAHSRRELKLRERLAAASLETLLNAIDANDPTTGAHARRVATYALILARAQGLNVRAQHSVERIALFHDVGKIHAALFDIVHDSASLSTEERQLIATHPRRGAEVLEPLSMFYPDLAEGVLSHHERWDGTGYPRKLKGTEIPLQARIVSIADTFDVITHSRPYKDGESFEQALAAIQEGSGTQFDPMLADLFVAAAVSTEVREAADEASIEHAGSDERRRNTQENAPDITFRWRNTETELPVQDQVPLGAPG